jgi:hypothetical protein
VEHLTTVHHQGPNKECFKSLVIAVKIWVVSIFDQRTTGENAVHERNLLEKWGKYSSVSNSKQVIVEGI